MITIYNFDRGVRGLRVAWQCEEMGLAWRSEILGYPVPPEYRAKYPPGSVPFLEDDSGVAMGESVAMMLYLAQRYGPTPLLPGDAAAMARTLQLTVFSEALLGGLMNPLIATRFVAPEGEKANWTHGFCEARIADGLDYAASLLGEAEFLVDGGLTLADIAISTTLGMWKGALDKDIPAPLTAHRDRMMARPAYERAKAGLSAR
jgi:glutathione S-transferase